MSRVILVSNRLPIGISEDQHGKLTASRSNGGLATALSSLFEEQDSVWVGWTGLRRHLTEPELAALALPETIVPINLTNDEITHYYDRYSNGVLWPLFHEFTPSITLTEGDIASLRHVLEQFADAVMSILRPDDILWIHDYHLLLLPGLLRQRGVRNRIGFFLHTPFPLYTLKNHIPLLDETIDSLKQTDVLGVQVERDAAAAKEFGLTATPYPIGVDFERIDSLGTGESVQRESQNIKDRYKNKQIITSLSRLDYSKGILTQLDAIELLAESRSDFIYRLNIAPSRESVLEYRDLHEAITERVKAINSHHPVIDFTYQNLNEHDVTALLNATDIQLNIPVKDGMNLVAKEHIAARRTTAVLVLSKEAGAADQLQQALLVAPNDAEAAAQALARGLDMNDTEKAQRWEQLRENVKKENIYHWHETFMHDLVNVKNKLP